MYKRQVHYYVHEWNGTDWDVLWSGSVTHAAGEGFVDSGTVGLAFDDGDIILMGFGKDCSATYSRTTATTGDSVGFGTYAGGHWWENSYGGYDTAYNSVTESASGHYIYDIEVTYWDE